MEWYDKLLEISLYCGIIFVLIGALMFCFRPKKINVIYGYRTPGSMSSQERWDFAQKYASEKMIFGGIALIGCSFIGLAEGARDSANAIGFAVIALSIISIVYLTETALNKRFPK